MPLRIPRITPERQTVPPQRRTVVLAQQEMVCLPLENAIQDCGNGPPKTSIVILARRARHGALFATSKDRAARIVWISRYCAFMWHLCKNHRSGQPSRVPATLN
ncbi:hypothetical protein ACMYSQ_008809 [Aspergillus niger]